MTSIFDDDEDTCSCCDCYLNEKEIAEGEGLCFPCLKGNCDDCGDEDG